MSEYNGSLKSYIDAIPKGELHPDLGSLMQNRLTSMGTAMLMLAYEIKCEEDEDEREIRDEIIKTHNDALDDMHQLINILRTHVFATMSNPKDSE